MIYYEGSVIRAGVRFVFGALFVDGKRKRD